MTEQNKAKNASEFVRSLRGTDFIPPPYLPPQKCEVCTRVNMLKYEGIQGNPHGEDEFQYSCMNGNAKCTTRLFTESQLKKIIDDTRDVDPI